MAKRLVVSPFSQWNRSAALAPAPPIPQSPYSYLGNQQTPTKVTIKPAKKTGSVAAAKFTDPFAGTPYAGMLKQVGTIKTPAQLAAQARALVGTSYQDELDAYNKGAAVEQSQISSQATRAQEYAKALGLLTAPQAGAIADRYKAAAAFEAGLGQGLTGDVAAGWQANTDRATQAAQQMTGGLGTAVGQYDPAAARSVAVLTGASMPAADLAEQGLDAYSMAQFARQANVGKVGDIAQQYLQKLSDLSATQDAERAKLLAGRSKDVLTELQNLTTNRQNQLTQLQNIRTAYANWKDRADTLKANIAHTQRADALNAQLADIKQSSADAYNQWLTDKTGIAKQTLTLNQQKENWLKTYQTLQTNLETAKLAQKTKEAGWKHSLDQANLASKQFRDKLEAANYWINPNTHQLAPIPSGSYVGKNGQLVKLPSSSNAGNRKTPSYSDVTKVQTAMQEGIKKRLHLGSLAQNPVVWSRKQIRNYLMNQWGNAYVNRYPGEKKSVAQMVDAIVADAINQYPKQKTNKKK